VSEMRESELQSQVNALKAENERQNKLIGQVIQLISLGSVPIRRNPFRRNPFHRNPFHRNPFRRNANPNPKP